MDAARELGAQINNIFGWRPDMKNFDMEVVLNLKNETKFGVAGDVIVDPMCGGGSIPLEGALAFPGCLFIGADIHPKALERCIENMGIDGNLTFSGTPSASEVNCEEQLLQVASEVAFLKCDAVELPFRESSVDAIVTDLPFGKKIGSIVDNRILYPRLLVEWERVVKPSGRLVVMTHDKRSWGMRGSFR
ncbi:hypothetical protein NECAME_05323 [Necator americanus]|uniref:THUMP domain-containing protein n=1 Tax=Necator americanus TaxID=51031 RepID=W2SI14_NECAM|nr:hypothetical protein NECAME_05323 [Necator americanus]ETN69218.1 hypothetical protein NECAME_05323 [Necator americanus]